MNSEPYKRYREAIFEKLQKAFRQEKEILLSAKWIANALKKEGWIYTSGTGHSHMFAEEIFYRAGGFARVQPILDPALMLHEDASGSTEVERREGYAQTLLSPFPIGPNDVFIISSNSGRNPVSIEMAQIAKEKGAKVIVLTNYQHSKSVDSRHSSGMKLFQVCDLFLDNFGDIGDAAIAFEGLEGKVGATSTVIGAALLQAIMVQAVGLILEEGIKPEVFISSNSDSGEVHNEALLSKYKHEVKIL
ncbi:MAG: sugar isomerase domain-containing protein [Algoriphagus aquaeductus]|jgi:uncharacterized phosphosugar-binding protein|uniref:Putative phosphosugar-binding protein n=1 Tax=Algoriphagus aquaeductus TaxID=475299 RepID=A0A326S0H8_9BACT|nr:SIS domain-containing protein [Algoriphagus aquaeductus]PZV87523.1 putative phosphosugar-binding protein [Algoriphagus aquaeductus]